MNLKEFISKNKIRLLILIVLTVLVVFLFPERSAYYHSAIWGSVGSIECPCYGYEFSTGPMIDAPSENYCIGYVDKSKCDCKVYNTSKFIGYCDIDKVIVKSEFIKQ